MGINNGSLPDLLKRMKLNETKNVQELYKMQRRGVGVWRGGEVARHLNFAEPHL